MTGLDVRYNSEKEGREYQNKTKTQIHIFTYTFLPIPALSRIIFVYFPFSTWNTLLFVKLF